ncbi:DUF1365 domain-containing protein [Actinacidiphila alni]|uniref:DUF1365 domain-containing protein n=1 Tax=Actinacidiphila alni TaxID=380248 RepID=UPI0033D0684B
MTAPVSAGKSAPVPDGGSVTPALYECLIAHARTRPLRHAFRIRTYMWLVDVDRLPRVPLPLRPLAGFRARDHFGGTAPTVRAGLDRFLAAQGAAPADGRVVMLTHARVLGHVFNPLTLYWCHGRDGSPRHVVAEVHNTYGERHCYLLDPDGRGRATTPKELYVSPFFPVAGDYRMRVPEPGSRLSVTVHLELDDTRPFTATVRGRRRPADTAGLLRAAVRHPWSTLVVSAGIRFHGVLLYLRGLPVRPRPNHHLQEGMR